MNTYEKDMQSIKNRCPSQVYILGNSGLIGPTGPTGPTGTAASVTITPTTN